MIKLSSPSWHLVKLLAMASTCLIMVTLFSVQGILAQECPPGCPDPVYGYQPYPSTIAYYFDRASRNQLGASGPTYPDIQTGWPPGYSQTYVVPAIILKAIGATENEPHPWYQFDAPDYGSSGWTVIAYNPNGTCDVGLMQLNSDSMDYYGVDRCDAAQSYICNIGGGARILISKWNERSILNYHVGENNPAIAEDWYYAIWAYNRWTQDNNPANYDPGRPPYRTGEYWLYDYPYQEKVWGWAANPPTDNGTLFWEPVPLTLPDPDQFQPDQDPPSELVRPSPIHPDPHASAHLSNIKVNRYDYDDRSVISVLNNSGDDAAVNITLYDRNGNPVGSTDDTLSPNESWTVNSYEIADWSVQYLSGSAVVASSPNVVVVVQNRTSFTAAAYDGISPSTAPAPDPGFGRTGTTPRALPVYKNYEDWDTSLYIQNTGPAVANVWVYFYDDSGTLRDTDYYTIQPNASLELNQADDGELGSSFFGSAKIYSSNQPVAVVVRAANTLDVWWERAYSAFDTISVSWEDPLWVPLFYKGYNDIYSQIHVQNWGSGIYARTWYQTREDCLCAYIEERYINYRAIQTFDIPDAPLSSYGSAWIEPDVTRPLLGLVETDRTEPSQSVAYESISDQGATTLTYAPIVYKAYELWDTGIQVQNAGKIKNAKVKAYFLDSNGNTIVTLVDWICPRGVYTFFLPVINGLPDNYAGSVRIESHDYPYGEAQNIVAVVNLVNYYLAFDGLASYSCLNR